MTQICFQVHSFVLPLWAQILLKDTADYPVNMQLNRKAPCTIAISRSRVKNTEWETTAGGAWPSLAI